jgi:hypothetical protein
MGCLQVRKIGKGRCSSFRIQRESLESEGFKLIEKKEETIPSPIQQFRGRQLLIQLIL